MRKTLLQLALALSCLLPFGPDARAGVVIDRMVAIVNGHVILQSDWDDAVCFEAFAEGRPVSQVSDQDRAAALERLIDQELLREHARAGDLEKIPEAQLQEKVQQIRRQHPDAASDSAWRSLLSQYGLDEKKLEERLAQDLGIMHEVEARLRPTAQVDAAAIQAYYQQTFLPQLRKTGAAEVPLADVSSRIREILTEQKVNELFTAWMQTLRSESKIRTLAPIPSETHAVGGSQ